MTTPFEEAVANKVYDLGERDCQCENCTIDRAIRVTIEALAQEAASSDLEIGGDVGGEQNAYFDAGGFVADWLRSHLADGDT